jgi:hypothetical protein
MLKEKYYVHATIDGKLKWSIVRADRIIEAERALRKKHKKIRIHATLTEEAFKDLIEHEPAS